MSGAGPKLTRAAGVYRAFLSYSHEGDRAIARSLQHDLRRFGRAWYRPPAFRIFRDDTELAAGSSLRSSIKDAIDASDYFVLLASPAAARSPWVRAEVAHRLAGRGSTGLLVVLTDGELVWDDAAGAFDSGRSTALPAELLGAFPDEPIWVDLRAARAQDGLSSPVVADRVADLAATLHGRPKAELVGEDLRQRRRWRRLRTGAVALLTVFALVAAGASVLFLRQRDEARRQAALAEARELAARATQAANPFAGVVMAVQSELRTPRPLPQAKAAYAAAVQRTMALPARPTGIADPGHDGVVNAVAWSPDGSRVATAADDGTVRVWDPATGHELGLPYRTHGAAVPALDWSPSGDRLASAGEDGNVRIWDPASGRDVRAPIPVTAKRVNTLAWSPDGSRIATGDDNAEVRIYNAQTGRETGRPLAQQDTFIGSVAWSPDGTRLVSCGVEDVVVWDAGTGRRLGSRHRSFPSAAEFSPDGRTIAVGSAAGPTVLWTAADLRSPERELSGSDGVNAHVSWSPDGSTLAVTGHDAGFQLWDVRTATQLGDSLYEWDATEPTSGIAEVAWAPAGGRLVTGNRDGSVRFWTVRPAHQSAPPAPSGDLLTDLTFAPDGSRVAGAGSDGLIHRWDARTGLELTGPLRTGQRWLTGVDYSPTGRYLASTGIDETLRVWDAATGRLLGSTAPHPIGILSPAWSPDESRIATLFGTGTGTSNGTGTAADDGARLEVQVWDSQTGTPAGAPITGHGGEATALAWSPDGDLLATGDMQGVVRIWEYPAQRLLESYSAGGDTINALAWSGDGRRLATAGSDGLLRLRDLAAHTTTDATIGRLGRIVAMAWSTSAGLIAVAGSTAVWLLDAEKGESVAAFDRDEGTAPAPVAFAPDGSTLAIAPGKSPAVHLRMAVPEHVACAEAVAAIPSTKLSTVLGAGRDAPYCADPARLRDLEPLPVVPV